MQVVFPTDWSSFHAGASFTAFIEGLDEATQAVYAERKAALMETMTQAEFYDGDFALELGYGWE